LTLQLDLVDGESASAQVTPPTEADDATKSTDDEDEEEEGSETAKSHAAPTTDSLRQVHTAEAEAYAKESNLLFYEASAKTGLNVSDLFQEIGKSFKGYI
jgi:Ras-related protein Rab-5C